jgi:hypothetical protein
MALLLVCFAAANLAAQVQKDEKKDDDKDKQNLVRGEVKKVDPDKGILVLTINGKDEEFKVPNTAKITVGVQKKVKEAEGGLKDLWFKSAQQAAGTGRFTVELTKDKEGMTRKVHLKTPTAE